MRIAIVSTLFGADHGGSEEIWIRLAREMRAAGHEVSVFPYAKTKVPEALKMLEQEGVQFYYRPHQTIPTSLTGLLMFQVKRKLLKHNPYYAIDQVKPDLIYINQAGSVDAVIDQNLYEYLNKAERPYIIHAHQVSELMDDMQHELMPKVQRIFGRARGLVFVSRRNQEVLFNKWKLDAGLSWHLSGNPVNLVSIKALNPPAGPTFRMATVASINFAQKGQDLLVRVLSTPAWRERDWTWSIYGSGQDTDELKMMIAEARLENKIVLRGFEKDMQVVWSTHHAHVLPTLSEGMPMAVVESLLCGKPVMATDIGGMREWVRDGENGFIAAKPEIQALSQAMEQLWRNRQTLVDRYQQIHAAALAQYNFNYLEDLLRFVTEN